MCFRMLCVRRSFPLVSSSTVNWPQKRTDSCRIRLWSWLETSHPGSLSWARPGMHTLAYLYIHGVGGILYYFSILLVCICLEILIQCVCVCMKVLFCIRTHATHMDIVMFLLLGCITHVSCLLRLVRSFSRSTRGRCCSTSPRLTVTAPCSVCSTPILKSTSPIRRTAV